MVLFGINHMAEFTSIAGALVAHGRGANQPYFGKQDNILPYSPREQKRKANRGFPGGSDITEREKEPNTGLFSPRYFTSNSGHHI
jgi:hypothetical protein